MCTVQNFPNMLSEFEYQIRLFEHVQFSKCIHNWSESVKINGGKGVHIIRT